MDKGNRDISEEKILKLTKENARLKHAIKREKYGLVWLDVPEAFEDDVENKLPILKEDSKMEISNKDDLPTNILIEGDNYHALTCLNYTHMEKIDFIYIDPPYNTGSDGFRYRDKRILDKYPDGTEVPKDHPLRHSYWLSFMKKRLELAKNLLRDNGLIFISIDDNESSQLKLLCDEIFGESNLILCLHVQVRYPGKTLVEDSSVQKLLEYVYVYGKTDKSMLNQEEIKYSLDKFIWKIKEKGKLKTIEIGGKRVDIFSKDDYEIIESNASVNNLKEIWASGQVLDGNSSGRFFRDYLAGRFSTDGYGVLYKVYGIGDDVLDYRYFTGPKREGATKGKYYQGVPKDTLENLDGKMRPLPIKNFVDFADSFGNCRNEGGVEFRSGKKPVAFISHLLKLGLIPNKNNLILDFFAGSGSTGHAVLELNKTEKTKHQFILVQINEKNDQQKDKLNLKSENDGVCRKETYTRMKNCMQGYNSKSPLGGSLKYYRTAFVGTHNILSVEDEDKIEMAQHAGELLAIAENTLSQIMKSEYYQIFNEKDRYTAIYFREESDKFDEFVSAVRKLKKDTTVYIFSWGETEFAEEFSDIENVRVKSIPQPILEIYKKIYNIW